MVWEQATPISCPTASVFPLCSAGESEPVLPFTQHAAAVEGIDVANPSDLARLPQQLCGSIWKQWGYADLGESAEGGRAGHLAPSAGCHARSPQSTHAFTWSVLQKKGQNQDWKWGPPSVLLLRLSTVLCVSWRSILPLCPLVCCTVSERASFFPQPASNTPYPVSCIPHPVSCTP